MNTVSYTLNLKPHEAVMIFTSRLNLTHLALAKAVGVNHNTITRVMKGEASELLTDSILNWLEKQILEGQQNDTSNITTGDDRDGEGAGDSNGAVWERGQLEKHYA